MAVSGPMRTLTRLSCQGCVTSANSSYAPRRRPLKKRRRASEQGRVQAGKDGCKRGAVWIRFEEIVGKEAPHGSTCIMESPTLRKTICRFAEDANRRRRSGAPWLELRAAVKALTKVTTHYTPLLLNSKVYAATFSVVFRQFLDILFSPWIAA